MKARIYFIESQIKYDYGFPPFFGGILGLSNKDESAGPLFIDYLYDQGKIDEKVFAILPSRNFKNKPKITYGGYQKEDENPVER